MKQGKKDNGELVAAKKLDNIAVRGMDDKQFLNEFIHVMDISHPNIVRLEGYWCHVDGEVIKHEGNQVLVDNVSRLICSEYMPNGNLEKYLSKGMTVLCADK